MGALYTILGMPQHFKICAFSLEKLAICELCLFTQGPEGYYELKE